MADREPHTDLSNEAPASPSDRLKIIHPGTPGKQTAEVSRRAFERVWAKRGWEIASDEDDAATAPAAAQPAKPGPATPPPAAVRTPQEA